MYFHSFEFIMSQRKFCYAKTVKSALPFVSLLKGKA